MNKFNNNIYGVLKLLQAEPIISVMAQLPARRAYSPEGGPGFLILIRLGGLSSDFFNLFAQNRNHFEEVSDDAIVGHVEDGCFGIFIDGQNHF